MDSAVADTVLPQIARLLAEMDSGGIRYVHWKSNNNIGRALSGLDDLDLLVHPADLARFEPLIVALGYVRGHSQKDGWQRNMLHFFTMDAEAGQLVHLHLHYGLTLGYDYHKNHSLPLVDWYLEGRRKAGPVWLPRPEREFIIFVIRVLLKAAMTGTVAEFPMRQLRALYRPETRAGVVGEFECLRRQGALEGLEEALASSGLPFSPVAFRRLAEVAERGHGAQLRRAAREVKQALMPMRDTREWRSLLACLWRVNRLRLARLRTGFFGGAAGGKFAGHGGRVIAFLGGDGAGKSTNSAALSRALGRHLAVESLHFGRPRRSLPGKALAALGKLLVAAGWPVVGEDLLSLALAHDRRKVSRRAERARTAGRIVILDRLHRAEITRMDGPRIGDAHTPVRRWLAAREQRIYRQIVAPDLLVVLCLEPELACQRRPEDDRAALLARSGEVWRAEWPAANMQVLDTGELPPEEVRARVFRRVWKGIARPFLRVEILGLTGAGKSTLARSLARELGNAANGLPYRRHPVAVVRGVWAALREGGWPCGGRERWQIFRNHAQLHAFLAMAQKRKITARNPARNLILDQGPLFQAVLCRKEGVLTKGSPVAQSAVDAFENSGGRALFLTAPEEALLNRLKARPAQGARAESLTNDDLTTFLADYAAGFTELREKVASPINLESSDTPEKTLQDALEHLFQTRRTP